MNSDMIFMSRIGNAIGRNFFANAVLYVEVDNFLEAYNRIKEIGN